jgi:hypothetical protein
MNLPTITQLATAVKKYRKEQSVLVSMLQQKHEDYKRKRQFIIVSELAKIVDTMVEQTLTQSTFSSEFLGK